MLGESGALRAGVVGRRALRDKRQAVTVLMVVEQRSHELGRGLGRLRPVDAEHHEPLDALPHLRARQVCLCDGDRHAGGLGRRVVDHPCAIARERIGVARVLHQQRIEQRRHGELIGHDAAPLPEDPLPAAEADGDETIRQRLCEHLLRLRRPRLESPRR